MRGTVPPGPRAVSRRGAWAPASSAAQRGEARRTRRAGGYAGLPLAAWRCSPASMRPVGIPPSGLEATVPHVGLPCGTRLPARLRRGGPGSEWAAPSSAGRAAARASALRELTRGNCLSGASIARAASFAAGRGTEQHRGVGAQRRPPTAERTGPPARSLAAQTFARTPAMRPRRPAAGQRHRHVAAPEDQPDRRRADVLFASAVIALQLRSMRESVQEEALAANRVAAQLLQPHGLAATPRKARRRCSRSCKAWAACAPTRSRSTTPRASVLYRSPPSPYKAGRDAPDWFERLISPPPSVQSIEFPDGKLVVRANASRAVLDAWDYLRRAGAASLGAAARRQCARVLAGRARGAAVRPHRRRARRARRPAASTSRCRRWPGARRARSAPPSTAWSACCAEHRDRAARRARREPAVRQPRAAPLDRPPARAGAAPDRARAARRARPVGHRDAQHGALDRAARARVDAEAEQAARLIADESSRLYDAMHGIIPRLAPLVLDSFGLAEALDDLVERTRRSQPGGAVELHVDLRRCRAVGDVAPGALPRRAGGHHQRAAPRPGAAIEVAAAGARGEASRSRSLDDGRGLPPDARRSRSGHYGLRWLAERVEGLGGRFAIEPRAARRAPA